MKNKKTKSYFYCAVLAFVLLGWLIYNELDLKTTEARFEALKGNLEATSQMNVILNERLIKKIYAMREDSPVSETTGGIIRNISAYNIGDINQCSDDPCISANGENICLALEKGYKRCAANFAPFGTLLDIQHYGICMVTDRMNSRYSQSVDIAMKFDEKERALNFGRQKLSVRIIK